MRRFCCRCMENLTNEVNQLKEYYKKVDKSFFNYGITIPKNNIEDFLCGVPIELGESREIIISWKKREYIARLCHVNRTKGDVYQVRWDNNKQLLAALKQEFIQSYFAIESQNFEAREQDKYYVTKLLGGSQEVVIFQIISSNAIKLETFIKIETPYDNLFKRLVEENVFGWISGSGTKEKLIVESKNWMDISDLHKHTEANHVIYYLVDETNKELYIGSAIKLGDRVKPNRDEIPGWNKFRYEIVHPKYHHLLRELEYHSIINFSKFFKNNGGKSNLGLSEYVLVNKDYGRYR